MRPKRREKARPACPIIIAHSLCIGEFIQYQRSLPQAAKGRFTEGISVSSLTEVGRQRQFAVQFPANVGIGHVSKVLTRAVTRHRARKPKKTRPAPRVKRRSMTRIRRKKRSQS